MPTKDPFALYSVTSFYHFTDRRNAASIRELGGLYSLAALRELGVEIPAPGGNDWSHDADKRKGLDRYVHLCLRTNHPMEFVARREGRLVQPVYLQISRDVLEVEGLMFTADVSNKSGVQILSLAEAFEKMDFEALYAPTRWNDPDFMQRLRQAEKYELLVPNHVPMKFIRNLPNG
jgi:hypothetical protein